MLGQPRRSTRSPAAPSVNARRAGSPTLLPERISPLAKRPTNACGLLVPGRDLQNRSLGKGPGWQQLPLLDGYDDDAAIDPHTVGGVHRVVEAAKRASADREAWYGDVEPPIAALLSLEYTQSRRALA